MGGHFGEDPEGDKEGRDDSFRERRRVPFECLGHSFASNNPLGNEFVTCCEKRSHYFSEPLGVKEDEVVGPFYVIEVEGRPEGVESEEP